MRTFLLRCNRFTMLREPKFSRNDSQNRIDRLAILDARIKRKTMFVLFSIKSLILIKDFLLVVVSRDASRDIVRLNIRTSGFTALVFGSLIASWRGGGISRVTQCILVSITSEEKLWSTRNTALIYHPRCITGGSASGSLAARRRVIFFPSNCLLNPDRRR